MQAQRLRLEGSGSKALARRLWLEGSGSKALARRLWLEGSGSKAQAQRLRLKGSDSKGALALKCATSWRNFCFNLTTTLDVIEITRLGILRTRLKKSSEYNKGLGNDTWDEKLFELALCLKNPAQFPLA